MKVLTHKELKRLLEKHGWYPDPNGTGKGSHVMYMNDDFTNKINLQNHSGNVPRGLLARILKDARLKEENGKYVEY